MSPGTGQSGKTTIGKQLKILHQNGFSPEEIMTYRDLIYKNILDECVLISDYCQHASIDLSSNAKVLSLFVLCVGLMCWEPLGRSSSLCVFFVFFFLFCFVQ